jgi:hypothetical protein
MAEEKIIKFIASLKPGASCIKMDDEGSSEIKLVIPASDQVAVLHMSAVGRRELEVTVRVLSGHE